MRGFQLRMHKKRRNNNNRHHFYSTQFQRTFNQMKRGVTRRGKWRGKPHVDCMWANKGKRQNPTHNSSVTKWHLLIFCTSFYFAVSFIVVCFFLFSRKYSKIFAESSGNAKVAHRVSWSHFLPGNAASARAICILGNNKKLATLNVQFPCRSHHLLPPPCLAPSALVVCCVFGMFHWQARLKYAAKSRAAPKTRSRWIQAEAVCQGG